MGAAELTQPIDVVITWVDGSDPEHQARRSLYMPGVTAETNATVPTRWENNNELSLCLMSVGRFAPWVNKIWIVTDRQTPNLDDLPSEFRAKIEVVDHSVIFDGFAHLLPTFNSRSIETMLWRIPGLAEHFVYLNDDVFLTNPCAPGDFFAKGAPLLRGQWVDWRGMDLSMTDAYKLLGARMAGFDASQFFAPAHVSHSMKRSTLSLFFAQKLDALEKNASPRFRDRRQFSVTSLHAHLAIRSGEHAFAPVRDWDTVTAGVCENGSAADINAAWLRLWKSSNRVACINDLRSAATKVPDLWLKTAERIQDEHLDRARPGDLFRHLEYIARMRYPSSVLLARKMLKAIRSTFRRGRGRLGDQRATATAASTEALVDVRDANVQ